MKHDSNAVHTFLEKVLNVLKIKYPTLQKCVLVIALVPSTRRTKHFLISATMNQILVSMLSNFFGTSHGKIHCDGIRGSVKCLVGNVSLGILQEPIDTLLKIVFATFS